MLVAVLLALLRVVLLVPTALVIDGLAVGALDGALNFCCREEKEGRLFERSEFASPPSLRHKFKESFAISGAPFFCLLFFGKTKKSESAPAGDETRDEPQTSINPSPQSNISQ
ncbi:hypothetical protein [Ralstonia wenshanensis]|uniref:hypothetical protein n=1 Tax=Ralstonia wenshanensis TaxID=2842456 RepID=UPI00292CDBF5|nr:hypothetical protein [Ralstonia wenshanensis]